MCGIAGILSKQSSFVTLNRLTQMADAIAHRGPDGDGYWLNESQQVGFAHRRLAIIDLTDAGKQPMHYLDRYTIVYNGEIYNYPELREDLEKLGYHFYTQTDTEVILAAYACHGENCLSFFDGMFSFAIWDEKEKELFAARDRFGEKPFFYFTDAHQFIFASEMKALWAAGIKKELNLKMAFNFLTIGYTDNPNDTDETFFEDIFKLPPASFIKYNLSKHELVIEKYWEIDLDKTADTITDNEALEQFDELFLSSVSRRMRSDVSIGSSLSGGLDSSSIIAAAYQANAESDSHTCFTATFPGFIRDEFDYAQQIANKYQLKHFTVSPSAADLLASMDKLLYHQEEPVGSASVLVQYKVYELVKKEGIKVLLDGQGADEILAGYHKYYKWYWQQLFQQRQLISSKEVRAAHQIGVKEKFGIKNIVAALFPDFANVFLERQYLVNALSHEDLAKEFIQKQSKEAYYTRPTVLNLNGALYFNTCIHGLEELLRYADRNSMAHGREVRLPFLNHELVEFLFSLPAKFKIRQGWTKWLLRKSMEHELPETIVWRRDKVGFEPPQLQWMQDKNIVETIYEAKKKLVSNKILRPSVLDKKIQPHEAHAADSYDWKYWNIAALL